MSLAGLPEFNITTLILMSTALTIFMWLHSA